MGPTKPKRHEVRDKIVVICNRCPRRCWDLYGRIDDILNPTHHITVLLLSIPMPILLVIISHAWELVVEKRGKFLSSGVVTYDIDKGVQLSRSGLSERSEEIIQKMTVLLQDLQSPFDC